MLLQLKPYLLPITGFIRCWFAFPTFSPFPIWAIHLAQSTGKLSHHPVQTALLLHVWCKTTAWTHTRSQSAPAFTSVIQNCSSIFCCVWGEWRFCTSAWALARCVWICILLENMFRFEYFCADSVGFLVRKVRQPFFCVSCHCLWYYCSSPAVSMRCWLL